MNGLILATLLVGSLISAVSGNALDDYVFKPDAAYGWVDMVSTPQHVYLSRAGAVI